MVITHTIDYFLKIRNNIDISNININLNNKIDELFNNYECFKDVKNISRYKNISGRFYKNKHKHKFKDRDNYKDNYNYKKTIVRKKDRTDDQIILSYLNKLSEENYDDLSVKIIDNIHEDNYKKIIDKLFEISYKQTNYSKLYIRLYRKIIDDVNISTENDVNISTENDVYNYLLKKIEDVINNKDDDLNLIIDHTNKNTLEYDDFCDINKNAKHLKGKIYIICNLIKFEIININKDDLINSLFVYKNYDNEIFLELLQILNNILKLDDDKINILQDHIKTSNFKGKMMIKFKLQDIIDNKPIKSF